MHYWPSQPSSDLINTKLSRYIHEIMIPSVDVAGNTYIFESDEMTYTNWFQKIAKKVEVTFVLPAGILFSNILRCFSLAIVFGLLSSFIFQVELDDFKILLWHLTYTTTQDLLDGFFQVSCSLSRREYNSHLHARQHASTDRINYRVSFTLQVSRIKGGGSLGRFQ